MMLGTKFTKTIALMTAIIMLTTAFIGSMPILVYAGPPVQGPSTGDDGVNTYTVKYTAEVKYKSSGSATTVSDTIVVADKYVYHSISNDEYEFTKALEIMDVDTQMIVTDNGIGDEDERPGIIRTDKVMAVPEDGVLYIKPATYSATSAIPDFKYTVKGEATEEPIFKVDYDLALMGTHYESAPEGNVTEQANSVRGFSLGDLFGNKETFVHQVSLPEGYIIDKTSLGEIKDFDLGNCDGYVNSNGPKASGYSEEDVSMDNALERHIRYADYDATLGGHTKLIITHVIKRVFLFDWSEHYKSKITLFASKPIPDTILHKHNSNKDIPESYNNYKSEGSFILKGNTPLGANLANIKKLAEFDPDMKLTVKTNQLSGDYLIKVGDYFKQFNTDSGWKEKEFKYRLGLTITPVLRNEETGEILYDKDTGEPLTQENGFEFSTDRKCNANLIPDDDGYIVLDKIEHKDVLGTDFIFRIAENKVEGTTNLVAGIIPKRPKPLEETRIYEYNSDISGIISNVPVTLKVKEYGKQEQKEYVDFLGAYASDAEYRIESIIATAMCNGGEREVEIKDNSLLDLDDTVGIIDLGGLTMATNSKDIETAGKATKRVASIMACTVNFFPKAEIVSINDEPNDKQLVHVKSDELTRVIGKGTPSEGVYIINEHDLKSSLETDALKLGVTPDPNGVGYIGQALDKKGKPVDADEDAKPTMRLIDSNNPNQAEFYLNQGSADLKSGVHKLYYNVRQDVGLDKYWSPDAIGMLRVNHPPIAYITDVEGAGYVRGEKVVIAGHEFDSEKTPFYSTSPNQTVTVKADALSVDGDEIVDRRWIIYNYKEVENEPVDVENSNDEAKPEKTWVIDLNDYQEVTPENKEQLNVEYYDDNELRIKFDKMGCYGIGYVATDSFGERSDIEYIELRVVREPVLLIHGYLSSPGQMQKIGDALIKQDYEVKYVDLKRASVLGVDAGINLLDNIKGNELITIGNVFKKVAEEGLPKKSNEEGNFVNDVLEPMFTSVTFNGKRIATFKGTKLETLLNQAYYKYDSSVQDAAIEKKGEEIEKKYEDYADAIDGQLNDHEATRMGSGFAPQNVNTVLSEQRDSFVERLENCVNAMQFGSDYKTPKSDREFSYNEEDFKDLDEWEKEKESREKQQQDNDLYYYDREVKERILQAEKEEHNKCIQQIKQLADKFNPNITNEPISFDELKNGLAEIYNARYEKSKEKIQAILDEVKDQEKHGELRKIDEYYMFDKDDKLNKFLAEAWDIFFEYVSVDEKIANFVPGQKPKTVRIDLISMLDKLDYALQKMGHDLYDTKKAFRKELETGELDLDTVKIPWNPISDLLGDDLKGRIATFVLTKLFGGVKVDLLTIPLRFPLQLQLGKDSIVHIVGSFGVNLKLRDLDFTKKDEMEVKVSASLTLRINNIFCDVDSKKYNDLITDAKKPIGGDKDGFYFVQDYDTFNIHYASLDDTDIIREASFMLSDGEEAESEVGPNILLKVFYKILFDDRWAIGYKFSSGAKEDEPEAEERVFQFAGMIGMEGRGVEVHFLGARFGVYANIEFLKFANGRLHTYANDVDSEVEALRKITRPDGKVTIIGKDMGGLIARHYAQQKGADKVKRLVLLATPNYGFSWAHYGPKLIDLTVSGIKYFLPKIKFVAIAIDVVSDIILGNAIHDMAPHSSFLTAINQSVDCEDAKPAGGTVPIGKDLTINNIYGTSGILTLSHNHIGLGPLGELTIPWLRKGDWMVTENSARVENMINHRVSGSFWSLPKSDEVIDIISHVLAGEDHYKEHAFDDLDIHLASGDDNYMYMLADATVGDPTGAPYQEVTLVSDGSIRQGGNSKTKFTVDSSMHKLVLTQSWSSGDTTLTLVAPDGRRVGGSSGATFAGATYDKYDDMNMIQVTVDNPQQGEWEILTAGTKKPEYGTDIKYNVMAGFTTDMLVAVGSDKTTYKPNEPINITAYAFNGNVKNDIVKDAVITVEVAKPDGKQELLQIYDDGSHNDGIAGDGIFGGQFTDTKLKGVYTFVVKGDITVGGREYTRQTSLPIEIDALANLKVYSDGIKFDRRGAEIAPMNLDQEGSVNIKATIRNDGDADVVGATIRFYEAKQEGNAKKLIGTDRINVPVNSSVTASTRWTPTYETSQIHVEIETIELPLQKDYKNKTASKDVKVKELLIPKFAMRDMIVLKGMPVTFNASETKIDIPNVTYEWDLDVENYGGINETKTKTGKIVVLANGYSNTDRPYKVKLTVKNGSTPIGQATINVVVKDDFDNRVAYADAGREIFVRTGEDVYFDGSRSWSQFDITMYTWDIDAANGNRSIDLVGPTPVLIGGYSKPGRYVATLTINDSIGSGPITDEVVVNVLVPELKIGDRIFRMDGSYQANRIDIAINEDEKLIVPVSMTNAPTSISLYAFGQPHYVSFEEYGGGRGTITIDPIHDEDISGAGRVNSFELIANDGHGNRLSVTIKVMINDVDTPPSIEVRD